MSPSSIFSIHESITSRDNGPVISVASLPSYR
uniref:Uncharacterized protein n=1 Tax=Siphoviridae sp. ctfeV1 TaxID=2826417 RepID=A0A8S5MS57_9CAUD|nr:MAG TPA: hypothetical protein [Siphoviridae sp. ctfeV1]DAY41842.1 MAG TPA: hypothetical protein [Caudoviricetes sp.]